MNGGIGCLWWWWRWCCLRYLGCVTYIYWGLSSLNNLLRRTGLGWLWGGSGSRSRSRRLLLLLLLWLLSVFNEISSRLRLARDLTWICEYIAIIHVSGRMAHNQVYVFMFLLLWGAYQLSCLTILRWLLLVLCATTISLHLLQIRVGSRRRITDVNRV